MPEGTSMTAPDGGGQDFFREPDQPSAPLNEQPNASFTPTRVQYSIRMRFNPIRNLTPDLLGQYLDAFRLGFFRNPALAWDAMERRDSRIQTVASKRKKSIARKGWEILTLDDSAEAKAQKQFLESLYNGVSVMTALEPDEKGGVALLIRQMMDAVGKRYAVHEIVWQPQPDGSLKARFIFCPLWWFEGTRGKLRFLLNEFQIYGQDMEPGGWMVTVGDGIMEAVSVAYMFKHLPLRDWLAFSEKFGTPGILGKTDAAVDSNEWNEMQNAVQTFGAEWASVCNSQNAIELIEAKGNGDQPFKPLVELMDEEITRLWRGADLGTSSKKDGAGASLQGDETEILEMDDAQMIGETLDAQVTRYALAWKFGPDVKPLAYLKIKATESEATAMDLKVDQFLLAAGAPLSVADALERYERPTPPPEAELLTPPAAPGATPADDEEEDPNFANDQPGAAPPQLIERGKKKLASAVQEDLGHILERLNEILQITDDALFLKKLQDFARDFPAFKKDILRDPAAARALQPILGAALANGLATNKATP